MQKISKIFIKKKKFFIENGVVIFKKVIPRKIINECLNELSKFKDKTIVKNPNDIVIENYKKKIYKIFSIFKFLHEFF